MPEILASQVPCSRTVNWRDISAAAIVDIARLRISGDAGIERIQIARDQSSIFIAFWRCAALSYSERVSGCLEGGPFGGPVISLWKFFPQFLTALSKSIAFHYEYAWAVSVMRLHYHPGLRKPRSRRASISTNNVVRAKAALNDYARRTSRTRPAALPFK